MVTAAAQIHSHAQELPCTVDVNKKEKRKKRKKGCGKKQWPKNTRQTSSATPFLPTVIPESSPSREDISFPTWYGSGSVITNVSHLSGLSTHLTLDAGKEGNVTSHTDCPKRVAIVIIKSTWEDSCVNGLNFNTLSWVQNINFLGIEDLAWIEVLKTAEFPK